jgi:hypothetical protein
VMNDIKTINTIYKTAITVDSLQHRQR